MNPQLALLFAQHKTAILGATAAGVAGLALVQRKKKAATATPASATAGATVGTTIAGTIPAAAVVPAGSTGSGGYDSSSYDTYNALQPELAQILQAQQALATAGAGSGITAAPAPVSSPILNTPAPAPAAAKKSIAQTLFAPRGTGNYVKYGDGTLGEVEQDGSIYGIAYGEPIDSQGNLYVAGQTGAAATALPWQHWNDDPNAEPSYGDKVHNLAAAAGQPAS